MESHKLYNEIADWWTLMSSPKDYAEEAVVYRNLFIASGVQPLRTMLELGAGGGNNASFLKADFEMTLVDLSPGMLQQSKRLNPELRHVVGDMRAVRLGEQFDAVFVHDAICYMTTLADLRAAMETAFVHCRPGGIALFAPDYLTETFESSAEQGGHDGAGRGMRYLAWCYDPDPTDTTYVVDYAYLLREGDSVRVMHDRHIEGIFSHQTWLDTLASVGFVPEPRQFTHSDVERPLDVFVARRA